MKLDSCWFIVTPNNRGIVYCEPSQNAKEAWIKATRIVQVNGVKHNFMGTGMNRERMEKLGYRARRLDIIFR